MLISTTHEVGETIRIPGDNGTSSIGCFIVVDGIVEKRSEESKGALTEYNKGTIFGYYPLICQ